jgi:hypothetical protein
MCFAKQHRCTLADIRVKDIRVTLALKLCEIEVV